MINFVMKYKISMLFQFIIILLPMFVCLFGVILLLVSKQTNLPKNYLALSLSISSINYFVHALYFGYEYKLFAFMDNVWVFTSLSVYPMFYYYIRLLTRDEKMEWKWLWILTPSILLSVFSFTLYFMMSPSELSTYIHGVMYHHEGFDLEYTKLVNLQILKNKLFKIIFTIQVPVYAFLGSKMVRTFQTTLKDYYSNISNKNFDQVIWVLFAIIFASIVSFSSGAIGKDFFINKPYLLMIPSLTHSFFLIAIIVVGYQQNFTIKDYIDDLNKEESNEEFVEEDTPPSKALTQEVLEHLLLNKKLFINPDLRIVDVAVLLGTNRTYLSKFVNDTMQVNFSDLVNQYRLEYAKSLMLDEENKELELKDIAHYSGFSSISSFYRVFKDKEKITPGDFRKSLKQNP